jgi:TrmH family RNA methyltransferase
VTITSRQNPLVKRCRDAARGGAGDLLLLDGVHLVAAALAARIAIAPAAREKDGVRELLAALSSAGIDVVSVSAAVMAAISPVQSASSIVALATRPAAASEQIFGGQAPLVVMPVNVQDPGNVGAIVRVAEAGGATGVIAAGGSASPFGWKALRGSMGSALRVPILSGADAAAAVADARRRGCRIVATVPREGRSLYDVRLTGPAAVLIGGEGDGLAASLVAAADERVTIPMQAPVESLNAAVTAALIVYEARRQRSAIGHENTKTRELES